MCLSGPGEPWATIYTKRPGGLDLVLTGPKNRFALGRVAHLGSDRELQTERPDKDVVKLKFRGATKWETTSWPISCASTWKP